MPAKVKLKPGGLINVSHSSIAVGDTRKFIAPVDGKTGGVEAVTANVCRIPEASCASELIAVKSNIPIKKKIDRFIVLRDFKR
jgi:hypothetical protein